LRRNEDWLLGAVQGENADARLFAQQCADDGWRGKDYVYAFMTEKDTSNCLVREAQAEGFGGLRGVACADRGTGLKAVLWAASPAILL